MVAEGDQVAVYFIFEGKHTGIPFFGVPATGKTVRFSLKDLTLIYTTFYGNLELTPSFYETILKTHLRGEVVCRPASSSL